ncbi:hypothetical protein GCM10027280_38960 [Micromonospora polyrhachis]|uniref:Transposase n=1 Tax=Micromonospora polyrhachis TaxID=1282883 RepID=A0A7W7SS12_9ACTN|nr:transposase [Micromonospora polyrhachis]
MTVFCGIDWSERHHDVALVDEHGQLVGKRRISDDLEGFTTPLGMLDAAGDNGDEPLPVAIETPRGLLVAALCATSRMVYSINPMAVVRYRERHSVSRKKSDHVDAMVLANILRIDAHVHRPLPADSELVQAVAVLARAHQDATWRRTRASNELRSLLRECFPVFLAAFAGRKGHLTSPEARAVLAIAPTPAVAATLSRARIDLPPPATSGPSSPPPTPHQPSSTTNAGATMVIVIATQMRSATCSTACLHHCLAAGQLYDPAKAFILTQPCT